MKIYRLVPLLAVPVLAVSLAACGGGGSTAKLGQSDVAAVGGTQITRSEFNDLMATAKQSYKSQGRTFPKTGTSGYATLKSQAVTLLVQQAEREEKAKSLGITVTDKQIQARLAQIKKQYFGGSDKKYQAQLKAQGLSDEQVRRDIKAQLISEALFNKVTAGVKVNDKDVHDYYVQHKSQYKQPESRDVRHILVKTKALADKLYAQLQGGADFAKLAKKYSQDPGSKDQGGKLTVQKGQTVAPFDKVAFSLKTGAMSKPVHTTYGWHIIQALGAIKPASTTPEKQVASSIRQQLLQTKKNQVMTDWVNKVQKDYCGGSQVKYQAGFVPSPDPCAGRATWPPPRG
jgi:parvulin-like peptidyl-prolyl isomerase